MNRIIWDLNPKGPNHKFYRYFGNHLEIIAKSGGHNRRQNPDSHAAHRIYFSIALLLHITPNHRAQAVTPTERKGKTPIYLCILLSGKPRNKIQDPHSSFSLPFPTTCQPTKLIPAEEKSTQRRQYWPYITFSKTPQLSSALTGVSKANKEQGKKSSQKYQVNSLIKICSS